MAVMTVARIARGAALTAAPDAVLRRCPRTPASAAADAVLRVPGVRRIVRGLAAAAGVPPAARPPVPDAPHGATTAGLAPGGDRWRTAARVDPAVAGAFPAAGPWAARTAASGGRTGPGPVRRAGRCRSPATRCR
jgi:hypothetical protein